MSEPIVLDLYEIRIVEELAIVLSCSLEEANRIILNYLPALRRLNQYDSPREMAQATQRMIERNWSVERWIDHINWIDGMPVRM